MPVPTTNKSGSLTIAGSGIASIKHITLETLSHIKEADKVYYVVADPATEVFIQDNSKGPCFDLTVYYDKHKHRYETYVQMCEVMLRDVRAGHDVLGIFYGHPGVFVSPSHRAIAIARGEGYRAKMLPGVSSEDYLFADIGFDPAIHGCMTQEATEILVRNKSLDPTIHNIIWQVGSVGVDTMVFDNAQFHFLVSRLEKHFGSHHKVVHYVGAVLPQSNTVMDVFSIGDLRKEDVIKQFTTTSTLYVPPLEAAPIDRDVVQKLGVSAEMKQARQLYPLPNTGMHLSAADAYGKNERKAIAQIDNHVPSEEHLVVRTSPAMRKFMVDLALNPKLFEEYKADPGAIGNAVEGLTKQEQLALSFDRPGPIHAVMRASLSDMASGRDKTRDDIDASINLGAYPLVTVILIGV